jgi:hypothetical protein
MAKSLQPSIQLFTGQVSAWLPTFVQYANNLDQVRLDHFVVHDVYRPAHPRLAVFAERMTKMQTAKAGQQIAAITGDGTIRIGGCLAYGGCDQSSVTTPPLHPPSLTACGKNVRNVGLRRAREAVARHRLCAISASSLGQSLKIGFKVRVFDLDELASPQGLDTCPDPRAQRF